MAISADVLASALQDLALDFTDLFTSWHPVLDRLVTKGKLSKKTLEGPYKEFTVVEEGPGSITHVKHGSEVINGGRTQAASRGNEYAPRLIYAFDVPGKDLAEANGKQDLARIIESYPELGLSDFHERIARQLVMGDGAGVGGFVTLCGTNTYNPTGSATARDGIFSFAAPSAQTSTVHGLVKEGSANGVTGWFNQYQKVTSFQSDGRLLMRKAYYAASREGRTGGPVDLMLGDADSYGNYLDSLDEHVRVTSVEDDHVPNDIRQGIKFLAADFFLEDSIDITDAQFSGLDPASGLIYGLKTNTWEGFTLGHSDKETKGFFDIRGPFRIPEQDLFRYEYVLYMGIYCKQLRANFAVCGAATP